MEKSIKIQEDSEKASREFVSSLPKTEVSGWSTCMPCSIKDWLKRHLRQVGAYESTTTPETSTRVI